jgi:hypothetical protein
VYVWREAAEPQVAKIDPVSPPSLEVMPIELVRVGEPDRA